MVAHTNQLKVPYTSQVGIAFCLICSFLLDGGRREIQYILVFANWFWFTCVVLVLDVFDIPCRILLLGDGESDCPVKCGCGWCL